MYHACFRFGVEATNPFKLMLYWFANCSERRYLGTISKGEIRGTRTGTWSETPVAYRFPHRPYIQSFNITLLLYIVRTTLTLFRSLRRGHIKIDSILGQFTLALANWQSFADVLFTPQISIDPIGTPDYLNLLWRRLVALVTQQIQSQKIHKLYNQIVSIK